jgi:hypothetical protein
MFPKDQNELSHVWHAENYLNHLAYFTPYLEAFKSSMEGPT